MHLLKLFQKNRANLTLWTEFLLCQNLVLKPPWQFQHNNYGLIEEFCLECFQNILIMFYFQTQQKMKNFCFYVAFYFADALNVGIQIVGEGVLTDSMCLQC